MSVAYGLNGCECSSPTPGCKLKGWSLVEYVLFCNVLWWISYFILLTVTRQSQEWNCRLLTFFHGSFASYSALRDIYLNGRQMPLLNVPLTYEQQGYLSYTLSYFFFDFEWILLFGKEPWVIYLHHISSIITILKILISSVGGLGVSVGIASLEFTNPYLQARWFLRTYGYMNKPIHTFVELWFFFLFFLIRLLGGTFLYYHFMMKSNSDIVMKFLVTTIYGVSLALAYEIYKYVNKKYLNNRGAFSLLSRGNREMNTPVNQTVVQEETEEG